MPEPSEMIAFFVVAFFAIGFGTGASYGPIARGRLERFARRQRLTVTASNGNQIIAYLATTRRWRAAGLVTAILLYHVWSLQRDTIGINALTLFAGWFAGALVAEARVAHLSRGSRRAASLAPRLPSAYLSRFAWHLLPASFGVSTLVVVVGAVAQPRPGMDWQTVFWYGVALTVAAAVRLTQFRVLRRPQPLADADVIAADDAIRSRSLHVLAGGGSALVLYCVIGQLSALDLPFPVPAIDPLLVLGTIAVPVLGFALATRPWRVTRRIGAT